MLRFLTLAAIVTLIGACASPETETEIADPVDRAADSASAFSSPVIHIGVVVSDLDRSLAFYTDIIGMKEVGGFELDAAFGERSGLTGDLPLSVKILKLVDSPEATQWKIMSFGGTVEEDRNTFIQDDIGMQYTTIMVNDLNPFIERIEAAGIPLLGETPIPLEAPNYLVLLQDPDGTFIELIGPLDR